MNKIMKYMGIVALALTGALMSSCGTDDDIIENAPQTADEQPAKKDNTVIVKLTVNRGAQTKALTPEGVKTFAVNDQIFLEYPSTSGATAHAVSAALKEGDITNGGHSATFTFELTNPQDGNVTLSYPASMLNEDGSPNESLIRSQNGTLDNASRLDWSFGNGTLSGNEVGEVILTNHMVVMEYTLKDASGENNITSTITQFTVSDGTNTYTVNRAAGAGPIYVVMYPTDKDNIEYLATDGTKYYTKSVTDKTYYSGHIYPLGLRMTEVSSKPANAINGLFTISSTKLAYFAKGNLRYTGSWSFFDNQYGCYDTYSADDWDKFGWVGSTGSLASATPGVWGVSNEVTNSYYGTTLDHLASDWGNVPGIGTGWRTLTSAEWDYLFNTRTVNGGTGAGHSYTLGQSVNSVLGVVLYPDNYTGDEYSGSNWSDFQTAGCVFLPAAGFRNSTLFEPKNSLYNTEGNYWSSTASSAEKAYVVTFRLDNLTVQPSDRYYGCSVRLIYSAN